ncbi:MAG TPA: GIY-YIG nuclease family protein [Ktedonobacterales bacterium]|nr:GIY-YIG nuclease family protein [Ktedonobacterales bacterium]
MKAKLPGVSGIYQIRCIPTGKIYIGSAVNLSARWGQHQWSLRKGKHKNIYLQNAWDRYGEANFEFSVLEYVDRANLLIAEQQWIDKSGCTDRNIGFNLYKIAGSPGDAHVQIWEGFIDPEGTEITISNLFDFCREHDLDWSSMYRLAKGKSKLKSHKGWTHRNSVRQREYIKTCDGFIAPDGCPAGPITNLAAFCREHGLEKTHMVAVMRGRIYSHRGWTYANGRQNLRLPKTYTGFINPDGQRIILTNLQAFCKENKLHPVHMHELKNGKRKAYKGWIWRETDEQSRT